MRENSLGIIRAKVGTALLAPMLLLAALVLALSGCGGGGDGGGEETTSERTGGGETTGAEADLDVPARPEEATSVVVRVSGTEGVAYSGNYGTLEGPVEIVDDTIGAEPTYYEVQVQEGVSDGVVASFRKTEPGQGELRVQTLADDKVVVESRTLAELGAADAAWLPQEMGSSEGPPPEEEVMSLEDDMVSPEEAEDLLGEDGQPEPPEVTSAG